MGGSCVKVISVYRVNRVTSTQNVDRNGTIAKHDQTSPFHMSLTSHLQQTGRTLSYVIQTCVEALNNEKCLKEKGLFRVSASKVDIDMLINNLNNNCSLEVIKQHEATTIACVLKFYLSAIPEPLITFGVLAECMQIQEIHKSMNTKITSLATCIQQLPLANYHNLHYLMLFLHKVALSSEHNKMDASNLALMLSPNLVRVAQETETASSSAKIIDTVIFYSATKEIVELMILFVNRIFPATDSISL